MAAYIQEQRAARIQRQAWEAVEGSLLKAAGCTDQLGVRDAEQRSLIQRQPHSHGCLSVEGANTLWMAASCILPQRLQVGQHTLRQKPSHIPSLLPWVEGSWAAAGNLGTVDGGAHDEMCQAWVVGNLWRGAVYDPGQHS